MTKPRVALVSLHFAQYATNLALALAERLEVLLVLYRNNADNDLGTGWRDRIHHSSLVLVVLEKPHSAAAVVRNAWHLVSAIKRFRPKLVHYQEEPRDEIVLALPFLSGLPTVLTVHNPTTHSGVETQRFRFSRLRLYRALLRRSADIAIAHGRVLADELVKVCPRFKGRVTSVAHGPLALGGADEQAPRPGTIRLLFFGRINEYKGLRYFVEAVIALNRKGYSVTGVVAGRGVDLERHRRNMEEAGCFEVVERYIPADEIRGLFLSSFVVVLPYTDGTQSGVAATAIGCGRPVIASAVGSLPELVRNGETGLLVPPRDSAALTRAIELLITDEQLWRALASGATKLRDGELSWSVIADGTIRTYKSLVEIT